MMDPCTQLHAQSIQIQRGGLCSLDLVLKQN